MPGKHLDGVEETAAASVTSWISEKIDFTCDCDEAAATVVRLNKDLEQFVKTFLSKHLCNLSFMIVRLPL